MKILLDTNIILDVLMDRLPHSEAATELFSRVENGTVTGCLCGTTITTIFYLAAKTLGTSRAQQEIRKLIQLFEVAPVNRHVLEAALALNYHDFEDAVIYEAACQVGADVIVTRNQQDFKKSRLPVHSAEEMTKILRSLVLGKSGDDI